MTSSFAALYGYGQKSNMVSPYWKEKYEKNANKFWDKFYRNNQTNFFRDRHWLLREFEELQADRNCLENGNLSQNSLHSVTTLVAQAEVPTESSSNGMNQKNDFECGTELQSHLATRKIVLDIGCGVGNTLFPLLEENPDIYIYAVDFSPKAIELIQSSPKFDPKRCLPLVFDITESGIENHLPNLLNSSNFALLIFVLSAISPKKMPIALHNLFQCLKPNGRVLFRDYAVNDMAQMRFEKNKTDKEAKKLEENFYVRGDGTRAFYFSLDYLRKLFEDAGFIVEDVNYIHKEVENRKEGKRMNRIFIQGRFMRPNSVIRSVDTSNSLCLS